MTTRSKILAYISVSILGSALMGLGCNDADSVSAVNVTLREFSVTPDQTTVPSGTVTFHVTNSGTVDHEFLVIRTDLAADRLPTEADGSYAEDGTGTRLLDEIEDMAPGQTRDLSLNLDDGNYVLICNMVMTDSSGTVISHYAQGMRTAFRVD
jgi:hypothetical protein